MHIYFIFSKETPVMKQREKLEDIQVNIEEPSRHLTRTLKRKLKEDNKIDAKKTNVVHVLLEKQISTPLKPIEDLFQQTPHQIRENEAEKRKELYLKTKADQKYFNFYFLNVFIFKLILFAYYYLYLFCILKSSIGLICLKILYTLILRGDFNNYFWVEVLLYKVFFYCL